MVFTSHLFLFYFLPLMLLVYYNLPHRTRNAFLAIISYAFYGWWKPWFVTLMLASTAVDYACGRAIAAPGATGRRRVGAVVASCCVNLGLLVFFKYYMFFAEGINRCVCEIPWFKHYEPGIIAEHAGAYKKVVESYQALLPGDMDKDTDTGGDSSFFSSRKNT